MRVRRRLLRLAHFFHCDVAKFGRSPLGKVVGTFSPPILDVLAELNDHLKLSEQFILKVDIQLKI